MLSEKARKSHTRRDARGRMECSKREKNNKNAAVKQPHATAKSAFENRFKALQNDEKEIDTPEENVEEALSPEQEALAEDLTQQKRNDLKEEPSQPEAMKVTKINSEGLVTHSKAKACSEESTNNSVEEQEPLSRKGRNSNKIIREQEATREKAAGKQSNLDFLVKNSQASK